MAKQQHVVKTDEVALLIGDIYECAALLRAEGERTAAAEGQTHARFHALTVIANAPATVPQVARRLGVSRQNLQRIANELQRDGLVEFVTNPDHRTSPLLTVTASGAASLKRINRRADTYHRRLDLDPELVSRVRDSLAELTQRIEAVNRPA
jgi:DNA-binding MarR family transcriptional regulator